ncbi:MAG: Tex-like N-terminal domain-containing protein [Planctomycetota bacterium]
MSDPPPRAQEAVVARLAADLKLDPTRVERALGLLDRGLPVPFLARYRREQVGGLDEDALTQIRERAVDLRELESRRAFVLRAVAKGGDAPPKLLRRIRRCRERTELEDLYLPTAPAAAPAGASPPSAGWARWPTRCSTRRPTLPPSWRRSSWTRGGRCSTSRRRSGAPQTSWPSGSRSRWTCARSSSGW